MAFKRVYKYLNKHNITTIDSSVMSGKTCNICSAAFVLKINKTNIETFMVIINNKNKLLKEKVNIANTMN